HAHLGTDEEADEVAVGRRSHADNDSERPPGLGDHRDARRGLRPHRALAQHRLTARGGPEVDPGRRAEGHDEGPRRQPGTGGRADGRGGRGEGSRRDRRDALRHLRDGIELDRDLRVRNRGQGAQELTGIRAVVFDLWNTIAEWPASVWDDVRPEVAARLGLTLEDFDARWYGDLAQIREMGPIADALAVFDAPPEVLEEVVALRRPVTLEGLVPVPGAAETIGELRRRGLRIGLITVCSED